MKDIIYIYTPVVTNRLKYTLEFVFQTVLRVSYELTTDCQSCEPSKQPFINYSENSCGNGIWIRPSGLLADEGVKSFTPEVGSWDELPVLFPRLNEQIPFDIFSAVFFLISRYEEYGSVELDRFGRYKHESSVAYRYGFLQRPLVDEWIFKMKDVLESRFSQLEIRTSNYTTHSTIDVDTVYRFLGNLKSVMFAKILFNLLKMNWREVYRMVRVLTYREADPYYQFEYLQKLHHSIKCKYTLFVLCGGKSRYDRMNVYPLPVFRNYLRKQNHSCIIGLHPSFSSSFDSDGITGEKKVLEKYLRYPATTSRHHYLRIRIPESYRILHKVGMLHDYTMGYAGMYGFRASTCHPFRFFDLEKNEVLRVKIHNNIMMDGTFRFYLKMTPEETIKVAKELIDRCKAVKGEFIMLWHNNSVADEYEWKGWRTVFEQLLYYSKEV